MNSTRLKSITEKKQAIEALQKEVWNLEEVDKIKINKSIRNYKEQISELRDEIKLLLDTDESNLIGQTFLNRNSEIDGCIIKVLKIIPDREYANLMCRIASFELGYGVTIKISKLDTSYLCLCTPITEQEYQTKLNHLIERVVDDCQIKS